jgi:hypothetical protein
MIDFKQLAVGSALLAVSQVCLSASYYEDFDGYVANTEFAKPELNRQLGEKLPVAWNDSVRVHVVSLDEPVPGIEDGPSRSPEHPFASKNSKGADGSSSLCVENCAVRFRYPGDKSLDADSWSELRFRLNKEFLGEKKGLTDIWVQYDQYVPEDYHYRSVNPDNRTIFEGGHKEFVLFADQYSGFNPTLIVGSLIKTSDIGHPELDSTSYLNYTFIFPKHGTAGEELERDYCCGGMKDEGDPIIMPAVDRGYWQRRTFHVTMPTSPTSFDGVVQFWVQHRVGEPDSFVTKVADDREGDFFGGDQNYLNSGYLLGWTNNGYNEEVVYLIDNFVVSDSKSGIDLNAITESDRVFPPNPPVLNAPQ